jgi:hypothetical protein
MDDSGKRALLRSSSSLLRVLPIEEVCLLSTDELSKNTTYAYSVQMSFPKTLCLNAWTTVLHTYRKIYTLHLVVKTFQRDSEASALFQKRDSDETTEVFGKTTLTVPRTPSGYLFILSGRRSRLELPAVISPSPYSVVPCNNY